MITQTEPLRILESKEREMALGGRGVTSVRPSVARQRVKPPPLDQACVARVRDRKDDRGIADEPGTPVDGQTAAMYRSARCCPGSGLPRNRGVSNRRVSRPCFEVSDEFFVERVLNAGPRQRTTVQ
jgi:hypothetical protein